MNNFLSFEIHTSLHVTMNSSSCMYSVSMLKGWHPSFEIFYEKGCHAIHALSVVFGATPKGMKWKIGSIP